MTTKRLNIAVVGSGIGGLSCAWLLSKQHSVTLFEKDDRFGGHSHTVSLPGHESDIHVDTGFIVFNKITYPNLTALFQHLNISVTETDMSFGVSLNNGSVQYSGTDLNGLFAQRGNVVKPSFWRMVLDILRFYRCSGRWRRTLNTSVTLRELLGKQKFSQTFINNHLIPMGSAIWSTPAEKILDYPALAFLNFCHNHGLLQLTDRPQWLTVKDGSREYVKKLIADIGESTFTNRCVRQVRRYSDNVVITDFQGNQQTFDHVVMACHADTSLSLLSEPDELEQHLLGPFKFQRNKAILHSDERLMPHNKRAWASWNYLGTGDDAGPTITYWMNRLQHIKDLPLFVTLNPAIELQSDKIHGSYLYDHPVFDRNAMDAQKQLWTLQGRNRTWYCGAWFGYGFHEDGLQSGLTVAEELGGIRRPWRVAGENNRLTLPGNGALM